MKCPKCGYLGFESSDRCRHCGYEFSLIGGAGQSAEPSTRPRATPLNLPQPPRGARSSRDGQTAVPGSGLDRPLTRTPESATIDLPLFSTDIPAGGTLPPPHRPLSVRRPTPVPVRSRARIDLPVPAALPLEPEPAPPPSPAGTLPGAADAGERAPGVSSIAQPAPIGRRAAAALVDLALLVLVDVVTLYFTLRLSGLEPGEWDVLPAAPLVAFFAMLNGGYTVLLTGLLGQTLGKMALQIEVVAVGQPTVGLGRAAIRALASILSALAAGLGFVWALPGDHRAWHDRLAGTRVVSVTAE